MSAYWKMLFVSGLMLMLSSCSTTTVDDYASNQPRLDLQTFFNGQLSAHGVLKDRGGKSHVTSTRASMPTGKMA